MRRPRRPLYSRTAETNRIEVASVTALRVAASVAARHAVERVVVRLAMVRAVARLVVPRRKAAARITVMRVALAVTDRVALTRVVQAAVIGQPVTMSEAHAAIGRRAVTFVARVAVCPTETTPVGRVVTARSTAIHAAAATIAQAARLLRASARDSRVLVAERALEAAPVRAPPRFCCAPGGTCRRPVSRSP